MAAVDAGIAEVVQKWGVLSDAKVEEAIDAFAHLTRTDYSQRRAEEHRGATSIAHRVDQEGAVIELGDRRG